MSLILEALKKSETTRRLGETPHLGTPVMPTRRRRNSLPLFIGLIFIAGGAGWWVLQRDEIPGSSSPNPKNSTSPPNVISPSKSTMVMPAVSTKSGMPTTVPAATSPVQPASTPAIYTSAPAMTPSTTATSTPKIASSAPAQPSIPPTATVATPAPSTTPPTGATPTAASSPTSTTPTTSSTSLPASTSSPVSAPMPDNPLSTKPAVETPMVTDASSSLPFYYQLAYALRKDLPAVKISMHVFAMDPTQRFVIINGARQQQGDTLATDLSLSEIRPNDVVLEFRSQRFVVPRNGM